MYNFNHPCTNVIQHTQSIQPKYSVPSKALLAASGRVREMQDTAHLSDLGIEMDSSAVKYSREGIAAHAKNLANRVKGNLEASLVGLGVDVIEGRGVLTGNPHEVKDETTGKVTLRRILFLHQDLFHLFHQVLLLMRRLFTLPMEHWS